MTLRDGDTILFIGDSITDGGRDREKTGPNEFAGLGGGYAMFVATRLLADRPGSGLSIYNRGVGGDTIRRLAARWEADCLALSPSVLSVLIGVNDTWLRGHPERSGEAVPVDEYAATYRELLERARSASPGVRLVLCEPFVLLTGAVDASWLGEMAARRAAVAELAGALGAVVVKFQAVFDAACDEAEPAYWLSDGVHPTAAGHVRMADAWRAEVGA